MENLALIFMRLHMAMYFGCYLQQMNARLKTLKPSKERSALKRKIKSCRAALKRIEKYGSN